MIRDEATRIDTPEVAVDIDEGGGNKRLHLVVVLQHVVGLHHGEGELAPPRAVLDPTTTSARRRLFVP